MLYIQRLNDRIRRHITELSQLIFDILPSWLFCADDQHIRLNPQTAQLFDRMLSRLGLHFTGCLKIGQECRMDIHDIVCTDIRFHLAQSF